MNEQFSPQPNNTELAPMIGEQLEHVVALVDDTAPEFKQALKNAHGIRTLLLPRSILFAADDANVRGPDATMIIQSIGLKAQYGSIKVFLTHARNEARRMEIPEEFTALAGIFAHLESRIGTNAAAELVDIGMKVVAAKPMTAKTRIRDLRQPQPRKKPAERALVEPDASALQPDSQPFSLEAGNDNPPDEVNRAA